MTSSRTGEWVNTVASIGVLLGLILVAFELRQTNEIAEAETFRTMWEMNGELQRLGVETDILEKVRISNTEPSALTNEDAARIDAYFSLAFEVQIVKSVMRDSYGLYPLSVEEQAADIASYLVGGPFGKAWFAKNRHWISNGHAGLASAVSRQLEGDSDPIDTGYYEELKNEAEKAIGAQ